MSRKHAGMAPPSESDSDELPDLSFREDAADDPAVQAAEEPSPSSKVKADPIPDFQDVLGDGRLLKKLRKPGEGKFHSSGDIAEVHYETYLDSRRLESTRERNETFSFALGEGEVIEAWDLAVPTMLPGEVSEFVVSPDLAYGDEGAGEIPPAAHLKFVIELLSGQRNKVPSTAPLNPPPSKDVDVPKQLSAAAALKTKGNDHAKAGEFSDARLAYMQAVDLVQKLNPQLEDVEALRARREIKLSCYLNLSHCALKREEYREAAQCASLALEVAPRSCKAFYRRGLARMGQGDWTAAKLDLLEAAKIDPKNAEVRASLEACRKSGLSSKSSFSGVLKPVSSQDEPHLQQQQQQQPPPPLQQQPSRRNDVQRMPKAWMDFQIGSSAPHRVRYALYQDSVPRTVANFLALCAGDYGLARCGQPLHYKRTLVHKVVKGFVMEAGDIQNYDGSGGESIYGGNFADEDFEETHHRRGLLSMANSGPDTNNSKFMISFRSLPVLDGKHVVFGEVISGMYVLDAIEALETEFPDRPQIQVAIVDCGREM